jgi:DUF2950 family protein
MITDIMSRRLQIVAAVLLCAGLLLLDVQAQTAGAAARKTFNSPDEGARALIDAAKSGKESELAAILGPAYKQWIETGDPVQDRQARERFIAACEEKQVIETVGADKATMVVGNDGFPFPIPLVKSADRWSFDPALGRQEILDRRVGKNELDTITTLLAIADAQGEYASADREGEGLHVYAQKFISTPGKRDGLYWPSADTEAKSPLGPLVGEAVRAGYDPKARVAGQASTPYRGYYFRMLLSQGASARGGDYAYVVKGRMIGGFAAIAYPARYGVSGFKTFMISHDRAIYEADLGGDTRRDAEAIRAFDPDKRWTRVAAD